MVLTYGDVSSYKQDSVWSWFICFCSTACMMLTIGFAFALGVLFPVLMDSFNESRERVGEFKIYPKVSTTNASVVLFDPGESVFIQLICWLPVHFNIHHCLMPFYNWNSGEPRVVLVSIDIIKLRILWILRKFVSTRDALCADQFESSTSPPGQPGGIWTFEDCLVQIPSPRGKRAVQMPHQLVLNYLSSKANFVFNQHCSHLSKREMP